MNSAQMNNEPNHSTIEWTAKYQKHLKSVQWKNTRIALFRLRGRACEVCKHPSATLEIHHLNYDRLGCELPSDLKIVCKACHAEEDQKRNADVAQRRESRRESAGFETWMRKSTGQGSEYANECDYEEFQEWKQRKREEW
jgi:hypothetical protein